MIMQTANYAAAAASYTHFDPLLGGSYTITYFRNGNRPCPEEEATEKIVHFYSVDGVLLHCEYHKIEK